MAKSPEAFRTISEVADWLGVPTHVLRFWESRFRQVKPVKRAGGRRYYRPSDIELLGGIKRLLHDDGLTIRGVQKLLREEGVKHVAALSPPLLVEQGDGARDVTPGATVVQLPVKPPYRDGEDDMVLPDPAVIDAQAGGTPEPSGVPVDTEHASAPEHDATPSDIRLDAPLDDVGEAPADAMTGHDDAWSEARKDPPAELPGSGADAPADLFDTPAPADPPPEPARAASLPQPPLLDEDDIYLTGFRPVAGLARLSPPRVERHRDDLHAALERALDLRRALDRADA